MCFILEVEGGCKPLWEGLSFGKQYKPRWATGSGCGKVREVLFAGSMTFLGVGTLLSKGGRKNQCSFPLELALQHC